MKWSIFGREPALVISFVGVFFFLYVFTAFRFGWAL